MTQTIVDEKLFAYQERLNQGCKSCGEKAKRWLQFHHREPRKKLFNIASGVRRQSITKEMFDLELEKCDVLCVVCHKKEHKIRGLHGPANASLGRQKKLDLLRNKLAITKKLRGDHGN